MPNTSAPHGLILVSFLTTCWPSTLKASGSLSPKINHKGTKEGKHQDKKTCVKPMGWWISSVLVWLWLVAGGSQDSGRSFNWQALVEVWFSFSLPFPWNKEALSPKLQVQTFAQVFLWVTQYYVNILCLWGTVGKKKVKIYFLEAKGKDNKHLLSICSALNCKVLLLSLSFSILCPVLPLKSRSNHLFREE